MAPQTRAILGLNGDASIHHHRELLRLSIMRANFGRRRASGFSVRIAKSPRLAFRGRAHSETARAEPQLVPTESAMTLALTTVTENGREMHRADT